MTINLATTPYYDDFSEDKNFHQIVFRPGYAVQARELTQIQSIINNQIKRFGDHIFKDGSVVTGGGVNYNDVHKAIRFTSEFNFGLISDYKVNTYYLFIRDGINRGWRATISFFQDGTTKIFFVTNEFNNPDTGEPFALSIYDQIFIINKADYEAIASDLDASISIIGSFYPSQDPTPCSFVTVDSGVTYYEGRFIYNEKEFEIIDAENTATTSIIGFNVVEEIITPAEDQSLLDPAQGTTNYAAPGADRVKVYTELTVLDWDGENEPTLEGKFIELMRVKNGVVQTLRRQPIYSDIMDTMARRTYDESGNYTVYPFTAYVKEVDPDETFALIEVSAGKAYVLGYENEKIAPTILRLDRALDTESYNGVDISSYYGNYTKVTLESTTGGSPVLPSMGSQVKLLNVANAEIGTAFIRSLQPSGSTNIYNIFLFDVNVTTSGASFDDVRAIITGTAGARTFNALIDASAIVSGAAQLYDTQYDIGIFKMPQPWIDSIESIDYYTRRSFPGRTVTGSTTSVILSGAGEKFYPLNATLTGSQAANLFTIFDRTSGLVIDVSTCTIVISVDGISATITFPVSLDGHIVDVIASIDISDAPHRSKTAAHSINTLNPVTVGTTYSLGNLDVFNIEVYDTTSLLELSGTYVADGEKVTITSTAHGQIDAFSGYVALSSNVFHNDIRTLTIEDTNTLSFEADITGTGTVLIVKGTNATASFEFDNGQRDHYYDVSTIKALTGAPASVKVYSSYYSHSSGQVHYCIDSYAPTSNAGTPRHMIYNYTSRRTNDQYMLKDCIDFRFDRTVVPSFGIPYTSPTAFSGVQLPLQFGTINTSFSFFLSRSDKIVMTSGGDFKILKGIPALQKPQIPVDMDNAMTLFEVILDAFSPTKNSISIKSVNNRRYTMKDIAKIDRRVQNLEYYTALSLLEKETANKNVYDSTGNSIFKNGFFVDAFVGPQVANLNNPEFSCSIDPIEKTCKPIIDTKLIEFKFDDSFTGFKANTSGIVASLPLVPVGTGTGPYTAIIAQPLISDYINVNPFNVIRRAGILSINPSSDIWTDTEEVPTYITVEGTNTTITNTTTNYNYGYNYWGWWGGYWGYYGYWTGYYYNGLSYYYHPYWGWGWWTSEKVTSSTTTSTVTEVGREVTSTQVRPIPWVRSRDITFEVQGMQPYTKLYVLFDNVDITTTSYITDKFGKATGTFTIPEPSSGVKFATGTNNVTLASINNLSAIDSNTSVASTTYNTQGTQVTNNVTVTNRKDTTTTTNVEKTVVSPWWRYWGWWGCWGWWDPVAQSFLIDPQIFPEGCSVAKISLYFKSKDPVTPVTVQLRPSVNGYPDSKNVFPFGSKTLTPDQVNISEDGTAVTDFVFDKGFYKI